MGTLRPTIGHHRPLLTVGSRLGLSRLRRYSQFGVFPIHRSSLPLIARQRSLPTPTPLIPPRRSLSSIEQVTLRPAVKRSPGFQRAVLSQQNAKAERPAAQEFAVDWSFQGEPELFAASTPEFIPEQISTEIVQPTSTDASVSEPSSEPSTLSSAQVASAPAIPTADPVIQSPQPLESSTVWREPDLPPVQTSVQPIGELPVDVPSIQKLQGKRPAEPSQKKASRKQASQPAKRTTTQSKADQSAPSELPKRRKQTASSDARSQQIESPSPSNTAASQPEAVPHVAPVVNIPEVSNPPHPTAAAELPAQLGSLPTISTADAPDWSVDHQPQPSASLPQPIEVARVAPPLQEIATPSEITPASDETRSETVGDAIATTTQTDLPALTVPSQGRIFTSDPSEPTVAPVLDNAPTVSQPSMPQPVKTAAPQSAFPQETGVPAEIPIQQKKADAHQKRSPKSPKKPSVKTAESSIQRSPEVSSPLSQLSENQSSTQSSPFAPESSSQSVQFPSLSPVPVGGETDRTRSTPSVQPLEHSSTIEVRSSAFEPDMPSVQPVQPPPEPEATVEQGARSTLRKSSSETLSQRPARRPAVPQPPLTSPEQLLESASALAVEQFFTKSEAYRSSLPPMESRSSATIEDTDTPLNSESPSVSTPQASERGTSAAQSPDYSDSSLPQPESNSPLVQGYSVGGPVIQRQTPTGKTIAPSDTVPAMLTPGEFVVSAQNAQKHLPLLHHLNQGGDLGDAPVPSVEPVLPAAQEPATPPTTAPPLPAIARKPRGLQGKRKESPIQPTIPQIARANSHVLSSSSTEGILFQGQVSDETASQPAPYTSPTIIHRSPRPSSASGSFSGPSSTSLPEQWNSVEDLLGMQTAFGATGGRSSSTAAVPAMETPAIVHRQVAVQGFAEGGEVASPSPAPTPETSTTETATAEGEGEGKEGEKGKGGEMESLAQEIYARLRLRLEIERERQGVYNGRLPW